MARRTVEEHFSRMRQLSGLNEASYSLVDNIEEDDDLPSDVWKEPQPVSGADSNVHEDDEEDPIENPESAAQEEPADEPPVDEPELDSPVDTQPSDMSTPDMGAEQDKTVDQLQNDMLKNALSAMLKMNDELKNFQDMVGNLENRINAMNKEVEEVKEPTNVEKLMSKKEDSHPYKLNLNDMWDGNWFQARIDNNNNMKGGGFESGVRQLEDGSFIADFDELPKFTDEEIRDSFQ